MFIRTAMAVAAATAFQASYAQSNAELGTVTVEGSRDANSLHLEEPSGTASRLGLSVRETPASVEILSQDAMQQRGARTFSEALRGMAGLSGGGPPSSPTTLVHARLHQPHVPVRRRAQLRRGRDQPRAGHLELRAHRSAERPGLGARRRGRHRRRRQLRDQAARPRQPAQGGAAVVRQLRRHARGLRLRRRAGRCQRLPARLQPQRQQGRHHRPQRRAHRPLHQRVDGRLRRLGEAGPVLRLPARQQPGLLGHAAGAAQLRHAADERGEHARRPRDRPAPGAQQLQRARRRQQLRDLLAARAPHGAARRRLVVAQRVLGQQVEPRVPQLGERHLRGAGQHRARPDAHHARPGLLARPLRRHAQGHARRHGQPLRGGRRIQRDALRQPAPLLRQQRGHREPAARAGVRCLPGAVQRQPRAEHGRRQPHQHHRR
jgi:hypothetical protein